MGLLSIGEEEHKGNDLTRAATPLLKALPLNFIGNVEGRDIYSGIADVVVCDGFIGNVALKVSEGLVEMIRTMLKESLTATVTRKIGACAGAQRLSRFPQARGLFRIRRRAAAGREGREYYLPRPVESRTRSRMRSAWRRSSPRARLMRKLKRSWIGPHRLKWSRHEDRSQKPGARSQNFGTVVAGGFCLFWGA